MGLNKVFAAILGATLVAWSGMSVADEYRPGELLTSTSPRRCFRQTARTGRRNSSRSGSRRALNAPARRRPPAPHASPPPRPTLRISARKNRAAPLVRGWRGRAAIRSTRRRPIHGFRPGRASPAASATGSDETGSDLAAAIRCMRIRAHEQIAGQHEQHGQRRDHAEHGGGDRKQSVGIQPSL